MGRLALLLLLLPAAAQAASTILPDGTVRFETGSFALTAESELVLDRLAALLAQRPELEDVLLVGHADDRGTDALNRLLSRDRAAAVREALVRRGVARHRLEVRGAGAAEPATLDRSPEGRARNRRVEVWVSPRAPVAHVARVERRVQAREAAAPDWSAAGVNTPLRRHAQVRTGVRSSAEVAFPTEDRLSLGPRALVVIYDSPAKSERERREVADIEVAQGTLFASVAAREQGRLAVKTPAAEVEVTSRRTRIQVQKKRRRSLVSVHEGWSVVSGAGRAVTVAEGFGTRVEDGRAPEAPRPLPPPPRWAIPDPIFGLSTEPQRLAWRRGPGTAQVEVQVSGHQDRAGRAPFRLWRVREDGTSEARAQPGAYFLRLAAIDDHGLAGRPGEVLRWISLAPPRRGGRPLSTRAGLLLSPGPGSLEVEVPPGLHLSDGAAGSTRALSLPAYTPGVRRHPLLVRTASGAELGQVELTVQVATASLSLLDLRVAGAGAVEIDFLVAAAEPVDGLELLVGTVPAVSPRLALTATRPRALLDCRCAAPLGATPARALGGGRYRWSGRVDSAAPRVLRLYEPHGLAAELVLPATGAPAAPPPDPAGWFLGVQAAASLSGADRPRFLGALELGRRFSLGGRWDAELALEAGGGTRRLPGGLLVLPLGLHLAGGWRLGPARLFGGVAGGVALFAPEAPAHGALRPFFGLAYGSGRGEVGLEVGRLFAGGTAEGADRGAWLLTVTARLGTWRLE